MGIALAEATTKWCPFARVETLANPDGGTSVRNRSDTDFPIGLCIGPACMAWAWLEPEPREIFGKSIWPDSFDDETEEQTEARLRLGEPDRKKSSAILIPDHYEWIPLTGEGEEIEGGYWQEPLEPIRRENERILAARKGCCTLMRRVA